MKKVSGSLLLLLTALIWGTAFVAQRTGMDHVGPFTFLAMRGILAALSLWPIVLWQKKRQGAAFCMPSFKASLYCGLILTLGAITQQIGLVSTTASKAGFIGALYVVLVPLLGLLLGKRMDRKIWLSVVLAVVGLFLLSGIGLGNMRMQTGDAWILVSAVFYALHILVVAHYAHRVDGIALSSAQITVVAVCMLFPALLAEKPSFEALWNAKWNVLYAGILSSGVAYTLQIVGQKRVPTTVASLILSLESVFSLLAGMLLLNETLMTAEWIGCALVLAAVIWSQLPSKRNE